MSFSFQGYQLTPGMHDERFTVENVFTWGRWDQVEYVQAIVDKDAVDAGNSPTTQLRTGLAMGVQSATGQFIQWNPYATDGSQYLVGFLIDEIDMGWLNGTTTERLSALVVKGNIKADRVIIPGESSYGIEGTSYEFLLREQAAGRFLFDDDLGRFNVWTQRQMSAAEITANGITLTRADHRSMISNLGATGALTMVLPAPKPGLEFIFHVVADQNITLDGPSTGEFFPTANTEVADEDDKQYIYVRGIRTATTPTYQYIVRGLAAPPAEA